jgi:hypothetical protein
MLLYIVEMPYRQLLLLVGVLAAQQVQQHTWDGERELRTVQNDLGCSI